MFQNILILLLLFFSGCQTISPDKDTTKKLPEKQEEEVQKEKIKLGLFISGAGANTFFTIPLLELLEKEKLHFDSVAGTGWGAWIAAMYAKNQSVNELKWNLFKLKEQGVFGTRWFSNKRKRIKILKTLTNEALSSPLPISFICPSLNNKNHILWMTEKKPVQTVLSCLHKLPPLFFHFRKTKGQGSLFSVASTIKYMQKTQGINFIIWIKPSISPQSIDQNPVFSLFWKELSSYLNSLREEYLHNNEKIILLEIDKSVSFLDDFSKLNVILKSSVPFLLKQKVYRLKKKIYQ